MEDAVFGFFEGFGIWARGLQRSVGGHRGPARPWVLSYETEKAFQTGVRMTVTETMPPDPNMLKFLLERRMPDKYREVKEVQHTHNAGALFQAFLKRMDDRAKKTEHARQAEGHRCPLHERYELEIEAKPIEDLRAISKLT